MPRLVVDACLLAVFVELCAVSERLQEVAETLVAGELTAGGVGGHVCSLTEGSCDGS
jgi:hypothetical protein